ncbi:MAG: hypothetical protein RBT63_07605 [Bdellovibrionales bacterium]|jgi:hypothetical protein|nr:hypothetical protein [Bdellovibrionales bacterium]
MNRIVETLKPVSIAEFNSVLSLTPNRELRVVSGHRSGQTLCSFDKKGTCSFTDFAHYSIDPSGVSCSSQGGVASGSVYKVGHSVVRFSLQREGIFIQHSSRSVALPAIAKLLPWYEP